MNTMYLGVVLVLLALFGSLLWMRYLSKKKLAASQKLGVTWLHLLRRFLANIQKHRGLSTAYINGDRKNIGELKNLESLVAMDIAKISEAGEWMSCNERWEGMVDHWHRLETNFKKNTDSSNNILQHNRLVQNTLYLIEEMADDHSLITLEGRKAQSIEFIWKDLLLAIEYLGQARAVGSGITAKKSCSSVDRIRMNYLYKKVQENCFGITQRLPQGDIAEREVKSLLSLIDQDILGARCNVESSQYFSIATKAIECLYQQYDETLEQAKPA